MKRLPGAPAHSAAALGRAGSVSLARSEGRATARNLRRVGVNVNLAPVLDVGRSDRNVVRLQRAYGDTAGRVEKIGLAFAAGHRALHVATAAKHFPGLGLAAGDGDVHAFRIGRSRAALRRIDERPFAAAARAHVPIMVVSHPGSTPRSTLARRSSRGRSPSASCAGGLASAASR